MLRDSLEIKPCLARTGEIRVVNVRLHLVKVLSTVKICFETELIQSIDIHLVFLLDRPHSLDNFLRLILILGLD